LIISLVLGISLGISNILFQEMKITRDVGNSVIAFYAADTGIEKSMMNQGNPISIPAECPVAGICYEVIVKQGSDCPGGNYCIQSQGTYKNTIRAIEIKY